AVSPDGRKLYVANFSSDTVSVIDTTFDVVIRTIPMPSTNPKPRGIAITPGGKVYVTSFLAQPNPNGGPAEQEEGRDDGRVGRVTVINPANARAVGNAVLEPLDDVGFNSNGSTLDRIPVANPPAFTFATGAFPNLLQGLAVKNGRVYL